MNEQEYRKWEQDALRALSGKYSEQQALAVIDWFSRIKGSTEIELLGVDRAGAMLKFVDNGADFDLYDTLMARLFIYAPLILKQGA